MKIKIICLLIFSFTTFFLCINNLSAQINDKENSKLEYSLGGGLRTIIYNGEFKNKFNFTGDVNIPLSDSGSHFNLLTGFETYNLRVNLKDYNIIGLYSALNYKINIVDNIVSIYPGIGLHILLGDGGFYPGITPFMRANFWLTKNVAVGFKVHMPVGFSFLLYEDFMVNSSLHCTLKL